MNLQPIKQRFGIIGNSASLNHALKTAIQVAPTDLTVLIMGESGVGKESFSKIIHSLSPRKHNKFIAVNCGAIPEGTINSELFGHAKGAFTGAVGDRKGYFETVDGGTIFLDEIGDMPLDTQTYLLRVLEQGEFVRVGSSNVQKVDVRVVAATNVNLIENIQQKKFREDLYYRLNTVPIIVPPLRERKEDIHLLFRKFVSDFAERYNTVPVRLEEQAVYLLENYNWPGNIRELKNVAEQVSVLTEDHFVSAQELIRFIPKANQRHLPVPFMGDTSSQDVPSTTGGSNNGFYEREILFKFLYDMKKDLNDVKTLIAELARTNNLQMPSNLPISGTLPPAMGMSDNRFEEHRERFNDDFDTDYTPPTNRSNNSSIIINSEYKYPQEDKYNDAEEVDESLSLEDMEQELIRRALKKHRGRRKEAAQDLGISERTLYRKIKQYNIDI